MYYFDIIYILIPNQQYAHQIKIIMKISWIPLCCVALILTVTQCSVLRLSKKLEIVDRFGLHQYGIQNNWQAITDVTKTGPLQEIYIQNSILSEEGLKKLLQEDLSKLRILNLTEGTTNPKVIKLLLSQDFIYELDQLILENMNLQCEDFEIIKTKKSKITKLSLKNNFISSKGLQYISRMSMNITSFNFYGNSLIHQQSIQTILKMGLNQIKQLNLGMTSIQQDHLLRILQNVNKEKLTSLTIRQNVYSASFYQKFTSMSFPALEVLDLFGLIIDQDGFKFFQSFRLPSLITLILHQNQLTSEVSKKIITKSNLPKLKNLDVNLNFLNSTFYHYLVEENFVLEEFKTRIINMDRAGLKELSRMDLSQLKVLAYCHSMTTPEILQKFLTKSDLSQLRELNFQGLRNTGNLFKYLLKANLKTLKEVRLPDIGSIDQADLDGSNIFPNLTTAYFRYYQNKQNIQLKLLENIQILAPNIEEFHLILYKEGYIINRLVKGHVKFKLTKPLKLIIYSQVGVARVEQSAYEVGKILITPNKTTKIIHLNVNNILNSMAEYRQSSHTKNNTNSSGSNSQDSIDTSLLDFDYSQVQQIYDSPGFDFFKSHIKRHNQSCSFQKLYKINLINGTNQNFQLINKCKMPILTQTYVQFVSSEKQIKFPNFPYLRALTSTAPPDKEAFIQFLEDRKFQYLIGRLVLQDLKITAEDMERIMKALPFHNRIRQLNLFSSFLNKNISSLSANNFRLTQLTLGAVVFSPNVFSQLCQTNFQFISQLTITKTAIDDNDFTNLISCLQKKNKFIFPKLKKIDLSETYIQSKSIQSLMKLHLPLMSQIDLRQIKDPEIFNSIFKYPSSKRLVKFMSYNNYLSSIDQNLDKKNTGRVQRLVLLSESIRDTDIQALEKFDFDSLYIVAFGLQKVDNCRSLQHLRKIVSQSRIVQISLQDSAGINSKCLQKQSNTQILPNQIVLSIQIPYGQARNFAQYFLNPGQQINSLIMKGVYVSDEKIIQTSRTADLQKLQNLILTDNDLRDVSIKDILGREYSFLQILSIAGNEQVTSESLSLMNGFIYKDLKVIDLSKTSVGDKGIEYLLRNQFPSLLQLSLNNVDLTGEGVSMLSKLKAPKLAVIDLSCNGLTGDEFALFQAEKFPDLQLVVAYPTMTDTQNNRLLIKFNRYRNQQKNNPTEQDTADETQRQKPVVIQTDIIRSDFDSLEMASLND